MNHNTPHNEEFISLHDIFFILYNRRKTFIVLIFIGIITSAIFSYTKKLEHTYNAYFFPASSSNSSSSSDKGSSVFNIGSITQLSNDIDTLYLDDFLNIKKPHSNDLSILMILMQLSQKNKVNLNDKNSRFIQFSGKYTTNSKSKIENTITEYLKFIQLNYKTQYIDPWLNTLQEHLNANKNIYKITTDLYQSQYNDKIQSAQTQYKINIKQAEKQYKNDQKINQNTLLFSKKELKDINNQISSNSARLNNDDKALSEIAKDYLIKYQTMLKSMSLQTTVQIHTLESKIKTADFDHQQYIRTQDAKLKSNLKNAHAILQKHLDQEKLTLTKNSQDTNNLIKNFKASQIQFITTDQSVGLTKSVVFILGILLTFICTLILVFLIEWISTFKNSLSQVSAKKDN